MKQCKHFDKDQRYMATSDIGALLNQGVKLDVNREREVCDAILKQFDDTSIDVQSIAVRTVPLLVAKSQQQQVVEICSQLCEKMLKGDESVRNLYAIGLKTCVSNLPENLAHPVLDRVVPKLIPFIEKDTTSPSVQDALEVVNDLLVRFGPEMDASHDSLIRMAIAQLSNPNNLVRKRAIGCLGAVSSVASDSSLNRMVETILGRIDGKATGSPRSKASDSVVQETIFVQAIGAIGRSAGNRLGAHVNRIIPLLFRHLKSAEDDNMQNAVGDDHRENIFQGLEAFVLRCPNEMQQHLEEVFKKTAEFIVYDPNFNYGDSDDEDMDAGGSEEDDDDYSNFGDEDDDTSWKVRRAAAKVLNSIIVSRPDALKGLYVKIQELLQKRFQERVESVRLDVLEAYKSLLEATVLSQDNKVVSTGTDKPMLVRQRSTMELLTQNLSSIIKSLSKLMRDKSKHAIKTKIMAFTVASKLVFVVNGALDESQLDLLFQPTVPCLSEKNSTLRLEALILCKTILHTVPRISPSRCESIKQPIVKCIQADWFKIVSEALKCITGLCRSVRPMEEDMFVEDEVKVDLDQWGSAICDAVTPRLKQHDIDQEIKNSAIEATGVILSVFGDHVGLNREAEALQLLHDRMKNESSRLFAIKAIEMCARSPAKLTAFGGISQTIADELTVLLRQQSREIRQHALSAYIGMVDVAGFVPSKANLDLVAQEVGVIIADSKDSSLAHLALTLSALAISKLGMDGKTAIKTKVADHVLNVCCSSAALLTGQAYHSLMALFKAMSSQGSDAGLGFDDLYPRLFPENNEAMFANLQKASVLVVAEACAVLLCSCPNASRRDQTILNVVAACADTGKREKAALVKRQIALIMLGEVGRRTSLAAVKQPVSADSVLRSAFEDEDESIKVAAASSLGKLVVGDPKCFLPVVMGALEAKDVKNHYLVLVSLREVLSSENAAAHVSEWLSTVVSALTKHCSDANEEVRNMVAECFGKLTVLFPEKVVQQLVSTPEDSPDVRWTKVTAMRHAVVALSSATGTSAPQANQAIFDSFRQAVCPHLSDKENLELCKAALMAVHALVHHTPDMALALFPHGEGLAEVIYQSTEVREELQKKVDFGPFKITVDDGLPLRKSAYSCLSAMLENAQDLLGSVTGQLIPCVSRGLDDSPEDAPDVPFVCHQIFIQLCAKYPLAVISQSSTVMKNFQKTLRTKLDGKDPEKLERKISVVKSAIRTLDHIAALPGALDDRDITETVMIIQKTELKQFAVEEGLKNVFKKGTEA